MKLRELSPFRFNLCSVLLCAAVIHSASLQVFAAAINKGTVSATYDITESMQIDNYFAASINPADFYVGDGNGRQFVVNEGIGGSLYYQNGGESVLSLAQLSSYLGTAYYNVNDSSSITTITGVTKGGNSPIIGLKSDYSGMTVGLLDAMTNVGAGSFSYSNFSSWEDEETGFDHWTYKFRGSDLIDAINTLDSNLLGNSSDWAFLFDFGADTHLDSLNILYEDSARFYNVTLNYNSDGTSNATPEPATMLIFGLGLAGVAVARRMKRR